MKLLLKPVLVNMYETEEYLRHECNDIDFTVVQPPGLTNGPVTDNEFQVANTKYFVSGANLRISRADVARYMLKILNEEAAFRQIQAIGFLSN